MRARFCLVIASSLSLFLANMVSSSAIAAPRSDKPVTSDCYIPAGDTRTAANETREPTAPTLAPTPVTGQVNMWVKSGHGKWCRGWGICFIDGDRPSGPHCVACESAIVTRSKDDGVTIEFAAKQTAENKGIFFVDRDLEIPTAAARQLGARGALVVTKGQYRPRWSADGLTVRVDLHIRGKWANPRSNASRLPILKDGKVG